MDLIKVGKLIAKQRKEKNMTQDELAEKFGITGKSVSKWERGINAPDISTLEALSEELNISVNELLRGELNNTKISEKNDIRIIDIINYYNNRLKHKNLITIIIIVTILLFIFFLLFTINNFNKCSVYSAISVDDNVKIDGLLIFNQNEKIMIINEFGYTDEYELTDYELKVNSIDIKIVSNEKVIFQLYENKELENVSLSSILNNLSLKIIDKDDNKLDIISKKDLSNMYIIIEYNDSNNIRD